MTNCNCCCPDPEDHARCDGCNVSLPAEELRACPHTYVDESTEVFNFCPACLNAERAYEDAMWAEWDA